MSLVLDASVAIAWVTEEQRTPAIQAVFDRLQREVACVPSLWWLEIANVLQMGVRRKRYSPSDRDAHLRDLAKYTIRTDPHTKTHAWTGTLTLADRHVLTLYDAAYLELALRRNFPLATLDRELRQAATVEGVPLLGH